MSANEEYARKVQSGKAEAKPEAEKIPEPQSHDTQSDVNPETPKKTTLTTTLFSGMNLVNWILAVGLIYAIYIAHQNKPKVVLSEHLDLLQERFDALRAEILGEVDKKIDARFDQIPWQVQEFAKVRPRPGQNLILYWSKGDENGETIEFDPAREKERRAAIGKQK